MTDVEVEPSRLMQSWLRVMHDALALSAEEGCRVRVFALRDRETRQMTGWGYSTTGKRRRPVGPIGWPS